ncbi:uncharacterized protein EV154DRAFT_293210 [Mucor mucedo]|uniref:uncharacterized protein n=1 Tax=Mucor mucedo TaxID=29922 RepID=UPI002220CA0C|nr:uncharacterized protein EV154DRAFT_293210 [Mucor mucedo]KAI7888956.1 hypothetical protein EV154DRAFT_293210 [Mucor mucedo]
MNILQNRIETFKTSMVKWPHTGSQYNKIETFAKAGFYFVRRPKYPDSLRCFMCDIELSNWRPGQSPFSRHTQESPTCALQWLNYPDLNRKLLAVNKKDPATDPRGATMRTARLATFINHNFWPPNKDMLPKKKYPSGNKLADAGFIFSPTPTQASRIRCLYCRITIEEPSANENLLHKHQELSNGCEFFSLTPNMRATRSRRDTIDSTHSHDTFSTAQSHPMDIGTNTEQKKRKPSIKSNQPSSQDYKQSTDVKQKTKRQRTVKGKPEDSSIATVDSLIDAEPIKIVSRKKSTEASATAQSIASHKGGISKNRTGPADVWDIDHMFSLPPISRRSAVTFGKSTGRRTLTSAKISEAGVNIFANLKTPLIAKSVEDESKPITSPSNHTLATTTKLTDEVDTLVQYKKSSRREDEIPAQSRTAKKRSLSSSSNTPNTNKHLRLKVVVDTKAVSPQPTTEDIFADNVPVKVIIKE